MVVGKLTPFLLASVVVPNAGRVAASTLRQCGPDGSPSSYFGTDKKANRLDNDCLEA